MTNSFFSLDVVQASESQLARLMQNILEDDDIDLKIGCPARLEPDFTVEELANCYRLAWELLVSGVNIFSVRRLVATITVRCSATPEQAIAFKLIRARFKLMRFACANCSEQHSYPESLDSITRLMGKFQDAFKAGQKVRAFILGAWLCCRLKSGFFEDLREKIVRARFSTVESFNGYLAEENHKLAEAVQGEAYLTARQFHELRKIISRRIALNDTRRVLYPSAELDTLSLFLATINGLMGDMHDELVLKRMRNELDYEQQLFKLPDEIASRIRDLARVQQSQNKPVTEKLAFA